MGKEYPRSVEHPERDEYADADESNKLDDRLGCDRQHQSILLLRGIDMARAKQDGEDRHCQRDVERNVTQHRLHRAARGSDMHEDRGQRRRHRFKLKRDVGDGADDGDERYGGGDGLGLAVTGGNEVGNRRDVLCLGQPYDAHDQRRAQPDQ